MAKKPDSKHSKTKITRKFSDTVRARAARDPELKKALMADLSIEDKEDPQESLSLLEILAKSQKNMKEGKVKPFKVAILKTKAQRSCTVKILKGNKITIPAAFRQAHDINPGDEVEFVDQAAGLIIIPTKCRPKVYGKLHKLATKVFEDSVSATLWLHESQFGLDGAIPVEHMKTGKGAKEVENLLIRIEYGVLA